MYGMNNEKFAFTEEGITLTLIIHIFLKTERQIFENAKGNCPLKIPK